jgi:sialate O-acetylesterase
LAALATTCGDKIIYAGKLYDKMEISGNSIKLYFKISGTELVTKDNEVKGFAIPEEDKKFIWATAKIEGSIVVVSSPNITNPVAVRYGWGNNPVTSLYNKENLPASPFRTDTFDK